MFTAVRVFPVRGKDIVRLFLAHHLNNELVIKYMEMFDEYVLHVPFG